MKKDKLLILGIMSGSSLDGIDMALCEFSISGEKIDWKLVKAGHVPYSHNWIQVLRSLPRSSAFEIARASYDYGYLLGEEAKHFLGDSKADYIASHGHTIFHAPELKMTCQIGNGSAIASASGLNTICDFRSMDIAYGGQGAPIVSLFDILLFDDMDVMVNLGGISNLTITNRKQPLAYDVGPCNQLMNYLAEKIGEAYDKDGALASMGTVDQNLLNKLSQHSYFARSLPKTLDNGYIAEEFIPMLDASGIDIRDKLRTVVEFISNTLLREIELHAVNYKHKMKVMITGGGANNTFLMNVIRKKGIDLEIVHTEKQIIDYKEAVMMAFLGFRRACEKTNVLAEITGASKDSIGGGIYLA